MNEQITPGSSTLPRFIVVLFALEFLLGLAHWIVLDWLPLIHPELTRFVDLGGEGNLPTWFSGTQLTCVAILLGVFALDRFRRAERPWGIVLGALIFLALSLDETAEIHEKIGRLADVFLLEYGKKATVLPDTGIWMFVLAPVLVAVFVALWFDARQYLIGFAGKRYLIAGAFIFLASATGIETLSNFVSGSGLAVSIILEEVGEMLGITVLLLGVYELCRFHSVELKIPPRA
jgi:hypothetical protein